MDLLDEVADDLIKAEVLDSEVDRGIEREVESIMLMKTSYDSGQVLPNGQRVPEGATMVISHTPVGYYSATPPDCKDGDWVTLYPLYMDSTRSASEGRRVPVQFCRPDVQAIEMATVIYRIAQLPCIAENLKSHPHDPGNKNGRVRVKLRNKGKASNLRFASKTALLRAIGAELDKIPQRRQRLEALAKQRAQEEAEDLKLRQGTSAPASSASSSSKKDKRKKK
jgi:signal recognition particle subunit SEC65